VPVSEPAGLRTPLALHDLVEHLARLEHTSQSRFELRRQLGQHLADALANVVLDRQAVQLRQDAIDASEAELAIEQAESDGCVLPHGLELRLSLGGCVAPCGDG